MSGVRWVETTKREAMPRRATFYVVLLLATMLGCTAALKRPFSSSQSSADDDGDGSGSQTAVRGVDDSSRPSRRSSGVFDAMDERPAPSADWQAANEGIVKDMHAHLKRRKQSEEADLLGRSPISKVLDFFGSQYFRNLRKSVGIFVGAWFWYVLNTKTYVQPEYED